MLRGSILGEIQRSGKVIVGRYELSNCPRYKEKVGVMVEDLSPLLTQNSSN